MVQIEHLFTASRGKPRGAHRHSTIPVPVLQLVRSQHVEQLPPCTVGYGATIEEPRQFAFDAGPLVVAEEAFASQATEVAHALWVPLGVQRGEETAARLQIIGRFPQAVRTDVGQPR